MDPLTDQEAADSLAQLAQARSRTAAALTAAMMAVYFGFILLVAYNKPLLHTLVLPGLTLGILLGVLVILTAWVLIAIYVAWANRHYDHAIRTLRSRS